MTFRLLLLLCTISTLSFAQTNIGLVAYYTFDGNLNDQTGNTSNTGIAVGTPAYTCGVSGQALLLDGANDQVRIQNSASVSGEFDREDFTVSFYFKPVGQNGTQYLISKRDTSCANARRFFVRYVPNSRTLNTVLAQDEDKDVNLLHVVNNQQCWQHVAVVRDDTRVFVYINGELQSSLGTASRINLEAEGPLYIGGSECIGGIETPFSGMIDEVRVYNRALDDDEVAELYQAPDAILNPDEVVFLGSSVQIELSGTCGTSFNWVPGTDVASPTDAEPVITPSTPGIYTYYLQINDPSTTCTALDSLRLTVVDPNTLPCQAALPKAFTPNLDNLNDNYGLSNPIAITDMISFEIFDRWGALVFSTNSPFERWDGTFRGEAVNPGIFLWRVSYRCSGEEVVDTGTVTVLR
ncbi:MAG: LamG-like jellyroll fold domain-containing protein [Saprospiraceae bacterium]